MLFRSFLKVMYQRKLLIEFLVTSLIISSDTSLSENKVEIRLNSKLYSPKEIFLPLIFSGEFEGADGSVRNPPKVATKPKISTATMIDDPVDDRPFLIF